MRTLNETTVMGFYVKVNLNSKFKNYQTDMLRKWTLKWCTIEEFGIFCLTEKLFCNKIHKKSNQINKQLLLPFGAVVVDIVVVVVDVDVVVVVVDIVVVVVDVDVVVVVEVVSNNK